jgi:hypothetical protein
MSSLISNNEKLSTNSIFESIFDTFSRQITVYKEPIKQQILPQNPGAVFGFGQSQETDLFTYTPVTGSFPAVIRYQNEFGTMGADDSYQGDMNTYISDSPISIKVRKDCNDFIMDGKTEKVDIDGLLYILKKTEASQTILWNTDYFIFELEHKM